MRGNVSGTEPTMEDGNYLLDRHIGTDWRYTSHDLTDGGDMLVVLNGHDFASTPCRPALARALLQSNQMSKKPYHQFVTIGFLQRNRFATFQFRHTQERGITSPLRPDAPFLENPFRVRHVAYEFAQRRRQLIDQGGDGDDLPHLKTIRMRLEVMDSNAARFFIDWCISVPRLFIQVLLNVFPTCRGYGWFKAHKPHNLFQLRVLSPLGHDECPNLHFVGAGDILTFKRLQKQ